MTEIIKNSKSISLDFIDTGTPEEKSSKGNPVFESVYSNLDYYSDKTYENERNVEETEIEKNVSDIIGNLVNLETKIDPSTELEIKELLLSFIKGLKLSDASKEVKGSEDDFAKLMDLLQKVESLLSNQKLKVNIQDDDKKLFLDQIRLYLNKKITAKKKIPYEQMSSDGNQSKKLSSVSIKARELSNQSDPLNLKATDKKNAQKPTEFMNYLTNKDDKNPSKSSKDISNSFSKNNMQTGKQDLKGDGLSRANQLIEDSSQGFDSNKKTVINKVEISKEIINKTFTNSKDTLNSENTTKIHDVNLSKADQNSNANNQNSNQSNFNSRSEHNIKLLDTLNMLSKTWGNKLIEKIEKSILNGDEKLEISLSPKSLGRLNITISIQESLTRINIVAESASAAALLGESENKLSQMMEASGLKLSTLLTSSQQFGNNNGKNLKHRAILKTNSEKEEKADSSNILSTNQKNISTKEGLNLIA